MLKSNSYPCAYCDEDIEVLGYGWNIHADVIKCPHCKKKISLLWDEDGSGEGWFYFERMG